MGIVYTQRQQADSQQKHEQLQVKTFVFCYTSELYIDTKYNNKINRVKNIVRQCSARKLTKGWEVTEHPQEGACP